MTWPPPPLQRRAPFPHPAAGPGGRLPPMGGRPRSAAVDSQGRGTPPPSRNSPAQTRFCSSRGGTGRESVLSGSGLLAPSFGGFVIPPLGNPPHSNFLPRVYSPREELSPLGGPLCPARTSRSTGRLMTG